MADQGVGERLQTLSLERVGDGVALVRIERPEKLNAMNHAFFADLHVLLRHCDEDPDIRVCVITGSGRAFSAGGDIGDFDRLTGVADHRRQVRRALEAFHAVELAQTVVVAAVNGLAHGGGTELTLACDFAIASSAARFAFREITVGLMPAFGVVRAPEVMGRSWTSWMALTGEEIDAEQALMLGLVQRVSPPERFLQDALELAALVASRPAIAVAAAKQFINRRSASGLAEAIEATAMLYSDPVCKELIKDFVRGRGQAGGRSDRVAGGRSSDHDG